jgi:hypothetical protein
MSAFFLFQILQKEISHVTNPIVAGLTLILAARAK